MRLESVADRCRLFLAPCRSFQAVSCLFRVVSVSAFCSAAMDMDI